MDSDNTKKGKAGQKWRDPFELILKNFKTCLLERAYSDVGSFIIEIA